jgi:hypothetical protein
MRSYFAIVTDLDAGTDDGPRSDPDVGADPGRWINDWPIPGRVN